MVRFLINGGKKIQLLPPPDPYNEEVKCDKCHKDFDTGLIRRACFQLCRHISCLSCIIKLSRGCQQCPSPKERALLGKVVRPINGIKKRRSFRQKRELIMEMPQVMVLSSVLTKTSEDDEDTFPEIKRLSLSALPVLGFPTEPPKHLQEEEDYDEYDEEEKKEEEEDEFMDIESAEIPLIELSDDEENIPVIELSSDEEENEEEKDKMFQKSKLLLPPPLQIIQTASMIVSPTVLTPPTQPSSPTTPISDIPTDKVTPMMVEPVGTTKTTIKRGPKCKKQVSGENILGNGRVKRLSTSSEENKPPRTLRERKKSKSYSSDHWDDTGFGKHVCKYCGSGFMDRKNLGVHMLQEHWDIRRFPCEVCDWPFDTQRNLESHMLTHTNERPFKCSICDRGFNRNYTLGKHMEKLHGVVLEKKRRGKNRQRRKSTKKSTNKRLPKKYSRSSRKTEKIVLAKTSQLFEEVFDEGTASEPIPVSMEISLDSPEDKFIDSMEIMAPSPQQMEEEQSENTVESVDDDDFDDYTYSSQDFISDLPPKKRFGLRKCQEMAPGPMSPTPIITKVETIKTAAVANNRKYTCSHCRMTFTRKMKLGTHLLEIHADKRPHACDLCGWSFVQKNKLKLHRITHTIDRPHKCKQCESTFNRKYSLERHVRIMHLKKPRSCEAAENKPYNRKKARCPYCHKTFESRKILGIHMIRKHDDRRPHICTECQWPFARKKHLVAHMKTHSKEQPWQCAMCDGKYNRRFSLERHMDSVHKIRIRLTPVEGNPKEDTENYCPECQTRYDTEKYAKVAYSECGHYSCMDCVIKAELGCGQCTTENAPRIWSSDESSSSPLKTSEDAPAKLFQRQIEVKEKVVVSKSKTLKRPTSLTLQTSSELNGVKKNGTKVEKKQTYKCAYCRKLFAYKKDLGIHMQCKHSDIRPHSCNICQWAFSSLRDLERHQITHTNERPYKCQMCSVAFNRKSARDRHVEKIHLKWRRI